MKAEQFLNHLDGVKPAGGAQWKARCPAHDDDDPSLSIRETENGKLLINCFAGCTVADVVNAVGLSISDLFPEPLPSADAKRRRNDANKDEIERSLYRELVVLMQILGTRFSDRENARDRRYQQQAPQLQPMPDEPWERELKAARRIVRGIALLYGGLQ